MKLKSNPLTRRIKYLALLTMVFDFALTLAHQPKQFWTAEGHSPMEMNALFFYFGTYGSTAFVAALVVYMLLMFVFIAYIPTRIAYVGAMAAILAHYFGASTWLVYALGFGVKGAVLYAIILALLYVFLIQKEGLEVISK